MDGWMHVCWELMLLVVVVLSWHGREEAGRREGRGG